MVAPRAARVPAAASSSSALSAASPPSTVSPAAILRGAVAVSGTLRRRWSRRVRRAESRFWSVGWVWSPVRMMSGSDWVACRISVRAASTWDERRLRVPSARASLISTSICEGRLTRRVIFVTRLLLYPVSGKYCALSSLTLRPTDRSMPLSSM